MKLSFKHRKEHVAAIFKLGDWDYDFDRQIFLFVRNGDVLIKYELPDPEYMRVAPKLWCIISTGDGRGNIRKDEKVFKKLIKNCFQIYPLMVFSSHEEEFGRR